jgi:hypothetical protein
MNSRNKKIFTHNLACLKSDFESFIYMLINDIQNEFGKGTLATMSFAASDELCDAAKNRSTSAVLGIVNECKGELDLEAKKVKLPVDGLLKKIYYTTKYTAKKDFETLLTILEACCMPAINELLEVAFDAPDSAERTALIKIGDNWLTGLKLLEKEFGEYKDDLDVPVSYSLFSKFDYEKPGEDGVVREEKKREEVVVIDIKKEGVSCGK